MNNFEIHECEYQGPGIIVENSKRLFHKKTTWQLVITREATGNDLEENHYLESEGDTIWTTVVEINYCPYCGKALQKKSEKNIEFIHIDTSGPAVEIS